MTHPADRDVPGTRAEESSARPNTAEPPPGHSTPDPRPTDPAQPTEQAPAPSPVAPPYPVTDSYPGMPTYQGHPTGAPAPYPASQWGTPPPVSKPGIIPLRPLDVGEILDGAISYIRANPKITLGPAAVVATIGQLIQVPATIFMLDGIQQSTTAGVANFAEAMEPPARGLGGSFVSGLVSFVLGTVLTGVLIVVVSRAVMGRQPTFGETWATVRPRAFGLIGLGLLIVLALLGLAAVYLASLFGCLTLEAPAWLSALVGFLGFAVTLSAVVFLWVSWSLAAAAYVLEGASVTAALRRSSRLVRPHWWRICGIQLLGWIIAAVLGAILAIPFSLGAFLPTGLSADHTGATLGVFPLCLAAIGTILATTVTAPFRSGITALLYFDQRIRREGLDIELAKTAQSGFLSSSLAFDLPGASAPAPNPNPNQ
jgi:hypothetical protein